MKLALLTNMPSGHQAELGAELAKLLGEDNFRLIFAAPTSSEREEMGWADRFRAPYILRLWESEANRQETLRWISEADVVVQGRVPMSLVRTRIRSGMLTFAYQERFWKRRFSWLKVLARLPRIYSRYWSVMRPNYHLLAAGAYVAPDLAILGCFRQRAWKFGYFINAAGEPEPRDTAEQLELLWCARFSPVKRAQDALAIARGLKARDVAYRLTMIGDGELRAEIERQAQELGSAVQFIGWQSNETVLQYMRSADALLMTSGFGEGWAMVINEAQNAACMVIANNLIGAAPWLIENGENGLLYEQTEIDALCDKLADLSLAQIQRMGTKGFITHRELWSAPVAASRLVALSNELLAQRFQQARDLFDLGPCSGA